MSFEAFIYMLKSTYKLLREKWFKIGYKNRKGKRYPAIIASKVSILDRKLSS